MRKGFELFTEAAELGSIKALFNLGVAFDHGYGVQQDEAKAVELFKQAAMKGHVESRYNLGGNAMEKGVYNCAVKHFLISAKNGCSMSVDMIKKMFMARVATKEEYAKVLKGYQDAMEEMKSHDRDEAEGLGHTLY